MSAADIDTQAADQVIAQAVHLLEGMGLPRATIIDRMMTWAAYASVVENGSAHTADEFQLAGDRIAAGAFAKFEPVQK